MLTRKRICVFSLGLLLATAAGQAEQAPKRLPVKLSASDKKFTFVAYGDTRSNPVIHRRIIREIVGLHPEFVLQSGDLVSDGRNAAQWAEFDQITQPLRAAHITYYPARGNHDMGAFYPRYVPGTFDSGDTKGKLYYAFTRHRNRFIIVDSMQPYEPGSPQYVWLDRELSRSQTAASTFVMFHEGPFSVGPHGSTPDAQKYLHPLFIKYHPRAVFCGHDHLYYRTKRDGVTYIVTGGGGAPPYLPENAHIAIPGDVFQKDADGLGRARYDASIYHTVRCEVDGPRVTATVIRLDGSIIDKFTLGPK